ncbi:MAG TPA: threonine/serine exporter family protein [Anaerovoracaceae bacterium]|nr:threonine/serine exporter family protein [Anaerovoracaceae bacterium]
MENIVEKNVLMLALQAGEIMLVSGSEIYRVEETVTRICKAYGISYVEVFVTTTGIFMSLDSGGKAKPYTIIKRIHGVSIDLERVSLVNNFSRKIAITPPPIEEAKNILDDIAREEKYTFPLQLLGGALAASFFTLMLNAGYREFICSVFIGVIAYAFAHFLDVHQFNRFFRNFTVCSLIALISLLFSIIGITLNTDAMIVGTLMIFLPGLAFTNAMRDSLAGDLLAGGARALEAALIASSIAFGVGITLFAWVSAGGVL